MTLRLDFISLSPGHPGVYAFDDRDMLAELDRELDARRRTYPGRIAKGGMTPAEAEREIAVMADLREDLAAVLAWRLAGPNGCLPLPRANARFGHEDKLHVLRREIHMRRTFYPQWVGKGRLSANAARAQLHRLEAVQARYWLDFWGAPRPTVDEVREHVARVRAAIGWDIYFGSAGQQPTSGAGETVRSAAEDPRMNEQREIAL
jgi:hypothetical protein